MAKSVFGAIEFVLIDFVIASEVYIATQTFLTINEIFITLNFNF